MLGKSPMHIEAVNPKFLRKEGELRSIYSMRKSMHKLFDDNYYEKKYLRTEKSKIRH